MPASPSASISGGQNAGQVQAAIDAALDELAVVDVDGLPAALEVLTNAVAAKQASASAATDAELLAEKEAREAADTTLTGAAAAAKAVADAALPKAGGAMAGELTVAADATKPLGVVTLQQLTATVNGVINGAPGALDTLKEIADRLELDEGAEAALVAVVAGKLTKTSNLSDVTNAATALANLGGASAAALATEKTAREAIETELGVNPSGEQATVVARLAAMDLVLAGAGSSISAAQAAIEAEVKAREAEEVRAKAAEASKLTFYGYGPVVNPLDNTKWWAPVYRGQSTLTVTLERLMYVPFVTVSAWTLKELTLEISEAVATSVFKVGIYEVNQATALPTTRLSNVEGSGAVIGAKPGTHNVALAINKIYGVCFTSKTAAPKVRSNQTGNPLLGGNEANAISGSNGGLFLAGFSDLPEDLSGKTSAEWGVTSNVPIYGFKKA
jgi:hypothetical protein